ncbi:hypothetical protein Cpir12675_003065 [Ceratocystis pirilliformis]|uniref:Uncharacterized protein n=1 Tax=Ceratocystis pirilliformis TaxID=259994 RepID=A0ABR3Z6A1_9PEZI
MTSTHKSNDALALTDEQLHALFYVLVHNETYSEISAFSDPKAIATAGYPFKFEDGDDEDTKTVLSDENEDSVVGSTQSYNSRPSSDPLLQMLSVTFVLPIPGLKDLPPTFWSKCVQGIVSKFGQAELSESYDQGAMGSRRTLSTAASAVIEAFARGYLSGLRKIEHPTSTPADCSTTEENKSARVAKLAQDWNQVMEEVVYGDFIDRACKILGESSEIEESIPFLEGAVEYAIIHFATFFHQAFIVSPEGPFVIELLEAGNKLIPYAMIRQILRVGNAATMVSGMARLLLSKLSLGSVFNWLGLTQGAEEGMNLLQNTVMLWDCSEASTTIATLEKSSGLSEFHVQAIKDFMEAPREVHKAVRQNSIDKSISIIKAILESQDAEALSREGLSDEQNEICMQLYGARLMVRDRENIVSILCKQTPDLVTEAVRDAILAYDPIIRDLHSKIDLSNHLSAVEVFVSDFLATCSPKKEGSQTTVDDFIELLKRHKNALYQWLHDAISKCEPVCEVYKDYLKNIVPEFREKSSADGIVSHRLSKIHGLIDQMFSELPDSDKKDTIRVLDEYVDYLVTISDPNLHMSKTRKRPAAQIIDSMGGPATCMASWQALVNQSKITPATPDGPVRTGRDVFHKPMSRRKKANDNSSSSSSSSSRGSSATSSSSSTSPPPTNLPLAFPPEPNTDGLMMLFGPRFKELLQKEAMDCVKV